jgi:hypothetical protein
MCKLQVSMYWSWYPTELPYLPSAESRVPCLRGGCGDGGAGDLSAPDGGPAVREARRFILRFTVSCPTNSTRTSNLSRFASSYFDLILHEHSLWLLPVSARPVHALSRASGLSGFPQSAGPALLSREESSRDWPRGKSTESEGRLRWASPYARPHRRPRFRHGRAPAPRCARRPGSRRACRAPRPSRET